MRSWKRVGVGLALALAVCAAGVAVAGSQGDHAVRKRPARTTLKPTQAQVNRAVALYLKAHRPPVGIQGTPGRAGATGAAGTAGPAGLPGATGAQGDPGPSFGDSKQVRNVVGPIPCGLSSVGSETITVSRPSRIWAHGHGTLRDNGAPTYEYGMWLELRDAADTQTLAVTPSIFDSDPGQTDQVMPLSVDSAMLAATSPQLAGSNVYVAQPGTYTLKLMVAAIAGPPCTTVFPEFGYNQGGGMGFVLLGTTP
jgi:hypothetical protein